MTAMLALAPLTSGGLLAPGITLAQPRLPGWHAVAGCPLLVIVGLTGTGKSTAMAALRNSGAAFSLLPNRRLLTDSAIVPLYADAPVQDRLQRFELARRFAGSYHGGMARIVEQLSVDPAEHPHPLVFDGLRGADEVAYAAKALPRARFLILTAPDFVRLMRLVLRNDIFDCVGPAADDTSASLPDADLLSPAERFQLDGWMRLGVLDSNELRAKLAIVAAERRNYDTDLSIKVMMDIAPERSFVIDTTAVPPHLVGMIAARLLAA
jgi:hypothetical protein